MHLISVRQIKNGKWSRDKVDDDQPQFAEVPGASFEFADVALHSSPAAGVQAAVDEAKAKMPSAPMILLHVHGYSNSGKSAGEALMKVAANLVLVGIEPALVLLTWPTDARFDRYPSDRNDARNCALAVSRVLAAFAAHPDIQNGSVSLNMLSHSMGNYLMAIAAIRFRADGNSAVPFANVILVAPDLDRDDLEPGNEAGSYTSLAKQATCYHSGWDGALIASQYVYNHNKDRLGLRGPRNLTKLAPNTVSVNCTDIVRAHTSDVVTAAFKVGIEVHSGYFTEPTFFADLALVLCGKAPEEMPTRKATSAPNSWRLKSPA